MAAVPEFSFRKVKLKGHWDAEHAMLLGPRVWDGTIGYHLVVPLIRSDGSTVLVDRGFVSKELADRAKSHIETNEVEILGMLRTSHVRNNFTPDNHPEKGEWYWADVPAMAEYAGGEQAGVQPVYVEEIFGKSREFGDCGSELTHPQEGMVEKSPRGCRMVSLSVEHRPSMSGIPMPPTSLHGKAGFN